MKKLFFILLITHFSLIIANSQWYQQQIPTLQAVQDLHFLDSLHGWLACSNGAVNDSGIILYTSTGGANWVKQYDSIASPLFAIKMANLNTGYFVGGFNKIFKTTNSGINWFKTNITIGAYFRDIAIINPDTFYVCVEDSPFYGILKSTTGGNSYVVQFSSDASVLFFINEQTGWAVTSGFNLRRTTNGGTNWVLLHNFPSSIGDISFVNINTGWVTIADTSRILKTTDSGLNWNYQQKPQNIPGANKIQMITETNGWISSGVFLMLRTTNGNLWNYVNIPVFQTKNICFIDTLKGWSALGGLIKTTNGGITFIDQSNTEIPQIFLLNQNFPNPFNPTTTIIYELPKDVKVVIKVYDILGREVEILLNEFKKAGKYQTEFNASNFTSGMYFYRIEAGEYVQTKKMVLLK